MRRMRQHDGRHLGGDARPNRRMELVHSKDGAWSCTAVGYCSDVCPKHVDPANAVNQNKTNSAVDFFFRFLPRRRSPEREA